MHSIFTSNDNKLHVQFSASFSPQYHLRTERRLSDFYLTLVWFQVLQLSKTLLNTMMQDVKRMHTSQYREDEYLPPIRNQLLRVKQMITFSSRPKISENAKASVHWRNHVHKKLFHFSVDSVFFFLQITCSSQAWFVCNSSWNHVLHKPRFSNSPVHFETFCDKESSNIETPILFYFNQTVKLEIAEGPCSPHVSDLADGISHWKQSLTWSIVFSLISVVVPTISAEAPAVCTAYFAASTGW